MEKRLIIPSSSTAFQSPIKQTSESEQHVDSFRRNQMYSLTIDIVETFKKCNPQFRSIEKLPQRILTHPSEGVRNDGADNEDSNLICRVHDQLECEHTKYTILDLLGTGTFGQVFRCQKDGTKEVVAVKVIKNKAAYNAQGELEIKIAKLLNQNFDPHDQRHMVRLQDHFKCKGHICLVFELLSMSLLDILTQNQFRGLPLSVVQRFTRQIIAALVALQDAGVIHCDLKPENILLAPSKHQKKASTSSSSSSNAATSGPVTSASADKVIAESPQVSSSADANGTGPSSAGSSSRPANPTNWSDVKLIDFGSACFEGRTMYSYIQSRFCEWSGLMIKFKSPHLHLRCQSIHMH